MRRDSCTQKLIKLDSFGQPFTFLLPDGGRQFRTVPGAICTIAMTVVILVFASYKAKDLVAMSEYKVNSEVYDHYFGADDKFGEDIGFAVAAAVTAFDGNLEPIEDERIGTVKFYLKKWSDASGTDFHFEELRTRPCEERDFRPAEEYQTGSFFPLREKFKGFQWIEGKLKCID